MRKFLMIGGVLAVVAGVYYYGDAVFNYARADEECIKFAQDNDVHLASDPDPDDKAIFIAKKWIKSGNVVVELAQHTAKKKGYYQSRLCVLGGGQIQLPSMFEQWQYK